MIISSDEYWIAQLDDESAGGNTMRVRFSLLAHHTQTFDLLMAWN